MKKDIGNRIRLARVTKGLSQQNIADELGLTVASYSNIERGVTDITISRLYEIAEILHTPIEAILSIPNTPLQAKDDSNTYTKKENVQLEEILKMIQALQEEVSRLKKQ